ncbi:MAG: hypothetical protein ACOYN5_15575, partial [Bacteroidales bacterium]
FVNCLPNNSSSVPNATNNKFKLKSEKNNPAFGSNQNHIPENRDWLLAVVTYYPPVLFFSRLENALKDGYHVLVFENSPALSEGFAPLISHEHLILMHEQMNLGLGVALNKLMNKASEMACEFVLYFDQDTLFSPLTLSWIKVWMQSHSELLRPYAAVQFTSAETNSTSIAGLTQKRLIINSGSMFVLSNLEKLGWHDPRFFVECVDYKFCLDSARHGFQLGMVSACPDIDHDTPQPSRSIRLFGKVYTYRRYPKKRQKDFVQALLRLCAFSIRYRRFRYVYIFFRNVLTFVITQIWYAILDFTVNRRKN